MKLFVKNQSKKKLIFCEDRSSHCFIFKNRSFNCLGFWRNVNLLAICQLKIVLIKWQSNHLFLISRYYCHILKIKNIFSLNKSWFLTLAHKQIDRRHKNYSWLLTHVFWKHKGHTKRINRIQKIQIISFRIITTACYPNSETILNNCLLIFFLN